MHRRSMRIILRIIGTIALCLSATLAFALVPSVAIASGPGPCGEITTADVATALHNAHSGDRLVTLQLSRSSGTIGTALTLTGTGWPASTEVQVDLWNVRAGRMELGDQDPIDATSTPDGHLQTGTFRAFQDGCSNPGDSTALYVAHTTDGMTRAAALYTYLPSPQLVEVSGSGDSVRNGAIVSLSGAGWEPGQKVTVAVEIGDWTERADSLYSLAGVARSALTGATVVAAGANGAFTLIYPLPHEPPDTEILVVGAASSTRLGDILVIGPGYDVLPDVLPSLSLGQPAAQPGSLVTLSGDHWLPGQMVQLEFCRGQTNIPGMQGLRCDPPAVQALGSVTVNLHGYFTAQIRLPATVALGPITLQARVPNADFGLVVYAQGQPLSVVPPFTVVHPWLARLLAGVPLISGAVCVVIILLMLALLVRRSP